MVILVLVAASTYIDFFVTKSKNTYPKIAIKKKLSNEVTVYNAILYKVWYCKTNDTFTIGSYDDKDAICPHNFKYEEGYYTNALGIKIAKKDLQMINSNDIYTVEMIENMNSDAQVQSALHVAKEYMENKYQLVNKKSADGNELVVFPAFVLDKKTDNYSWVYDTTKEDKYYCLKNGSVANYSNEECGEYKKIKMDKEWCESYEKSTLIYEKNIDELCKE